VQHGPISSSCTSSNRTRSEGLARRHDDDDVGAEIGIGCAADPQQVFEQKRSGPAVRVQLARETTARKGVEMLEGNRSDLKSEYGLESVQTVNHQQERKSFHPRVTTTRLVGKDRR
jgi:hypothetical protein